MKNKRLRAGLLALRTSWAEFSIGIIFIWFAFLVAMSLVFPTTSPQVYGALVLGIFGVLIITGIFARIRQTPQASSGSGSGSNMLSSDAFLYLKDWEMTKDRIKHFDGTVIQLRIQGIPLATAILAAGFIAAPTLRSTQINVGGFHFSALSLVFLASALFLVPIALLDWLHYSLLLIAVRHAIEIENRAEFRDKLLITHKLTSPLLTSTHSIAAFVIYASIIATASYLAVVFR